MKYVKHLLNGAAFTTAVGGLHYFEVTSRKKEEKKLLQENPGGTVTYKYVRVAGTYGYFEPVVTPANSENQQQDGNQLSNKL